MLLNLWRTKIVIYLFDVLLVNGFLMVKCIGLVVADIDGIPSTQKQNVLIVEYSGKIQDVLLVVKVRLIKIGIKLLGKLNYSTNRRMMRLEQGRKIWK